jgi:hypothetical protein
MSKSTVGVLLRKLVEVEQQGAGRYFGEPELDVDDLFRQDERGRGVISILELSDLSDRPALFSTFMMWLLATLYRELPEAGDLPKPKLVFFFDEAHHLFSGSNKAFEEQIEQVVRLIRSKGVGVYFVTQTPKDIAPDVLAQLGNRIQHALRAFTPDDEKALKATARTMPKTSYYDVPDVLTKLGIGEAFVTVLDPRGVPTPLAATLLAPPASLMGPIAEQEVQSRVSGSPLYGRYSQTIDRESAREVLQARLEEAQAQARAAEEAEAASREARKREPILRAPGAPSSRPRASSRSGQSTAAQVLKSPLARAMGQELVRGIFGVLGVKTSRRRRW